MRRLVVVLLACVFSSLAVTSAGATTLNPRIIGGAATAIQAVPWQVGVAIDPDLDPAHHGIVPAHAGFCGGVILDATHILTAAHCVISDSEDRDSPATSPWYFAVFSGTSYVNLGDAYPDVTFVKKATPDPMYDGGNYDVAVLELEDPLELDGVNRAAINLADAIPATGTGLEVSGWGATAEGGDLQTALRLADVKTSDWAACQSVYQSQQLALTTGAIVCAHETNPSRDACQGDSGGPLVQMTQPLPTLVGLVSAGIGCGEADYPGIYTAVSDPHVRDFIDQYTIADPPPLPLRPELLNGTMPWLSGTLKVGETLTCVTGLWSNDPVYHFTFFDPNAKLQLQTATGLSATYKILPSDAGRTITCLVRAANIGDFNPVKSNPVGPIGANSQTQTPEHRVTTPRDIVKPRAVVTQTRCKGKRCVLHVAVVDTGFTSGAPKIAASVKTFVGKRVVRSKLTIRSQKTAGYFLVIAPKLPRGKHVFRIVATDFAGNVQAKATVKNVKGK